MIPGSISRITESHVDVASTITVKTDLVIVHGNGVINTINPGMGTEQGQFLMLWCVGIVILGTSGNVDSGLREAITDRQLPVEIVKYRPLVLVYLKYFKRWYVVAGANEVASGALNWWRLSDPSGTVAKDLLGAGNGVISGGVTLGVPGALPSGDKAMTFDGVSGKIMVNVPLPPTAATLTVWIKTTFAGQQPIFSTRVPGSPTNSHVYLGTNTGKVLVSTDLSVNMGTKLVNDGNWHHIALVFIGINCVVYIDGVFDSTFAVAPRGSIWPTGSIAWDGKNNEFWNGSLDELIIWPFGMNSQKVNEFYTTDY